MGRTPLDRRIPAAPFRDWLHARLAELHAAEAITDPAAILARRLRRDERWVYKWTNPNGEYYDLEELDRETIASALHDAGLGLWECYPLELDDPGEVHDRYCTLCRAETVTGPSLRCSWCDSPTRKRRRGGLPAGVYGQLTDYELRILHRIHVEYGVAQNELGRQLWQRKGYASALSASDAIRRGWRRLALPARDRTSARRVQARRDCGAEVPFEALAVAA